MKDEGGSRPGKAKSSHIDRGREGEEEAARQLRDRGYEIVSRNFRTARGEVDIIARHKGMLVFIEVKTRRNCRFGAPQEAVDFRKQARLRNMARYYLYRKGTPDLPCRFDIVSVTLESGTVEVIENAF